VYPASWRRRYGDEFSALLDDVVAPTLRDVIDVVQGGVMMRIQMAGPAMRAAACGAIGLAAAAGAARMTSRRVESTALLVYQRPDAASNGTSGRAGPALLGIARHALTDDFIESLAERGEGSSARTAERVDEMKRGIRVELMEPRILRVSYASDDAERSRDVAREISAHIIRAGLEERLSGAMPAGTLRVVSDAGPAQASVSSDRIALAGTVGLAAGALVGVLLGGPGRRRSEPA
jgi:hypothetical protein